MAYERPLGPVKVASPGQIRWWLNPDSARARAEIPPTCAAADRCRSRAGWRSS